MIGKTISLADARKLIDSGGDRSGLSLSIDDVRQLRSEGKEWSTAKRTCTPAQANTSRVPRATTPETIIRDLCAIAGQPELAGEYLEQGLSPEKVRATLLNVVNPGQGPLVQHAKRMAEAHASGMTPIPSSLRDNRLVQHAERLAQDARKRVN